MRKHAGVERPLEAFIISPPRPARHARFVRTRQIDLTGQHDIGHQVGCSIGNGLPVGKGVECSRRNERAAYRPASKALLHFPHSVLAAIRDQCADLQSRTGTEASSFLGWSQGETAVRGRARCPSNKDRLEAYPTLISRRARTALTVWQASGATWQLPLSTGRSRIGGPATAALP